MASYGRRKVSMSFILYEASFSMKENEAPGERMEDRHDTAGEGSSIGRIAVCCSVLQCVAVRCSAVQCVAEGYNVLQCVHNVRRRTKLNQEG